eukprot:TRINITY_DN40_c0_g1_i13.p1 TRINITY_DN40_c0_g1~~TRINITY_DN40_c0_g1_i13.p1  ORF type:complete len:109 (-),score=1.88 TRINITY_DN40_c0_g1_i13:13-339(-)
MLPSIIWAMRFITRWRKSACKNIGMINLYHSLYFHVILKGYYISGRKYFGSEGFESFWVRSEEDSCRLVQAVVCHCVDQHQNVQDLSLIHICRCRRIERCRSRWSPYH